MGYVVSTLRDNICTCFGRVEEPKDIETDLITPNTIQPDIEHGTTDNLYDMRNLKYSTLDDHELNVRIKYYVLNNGKVIHMV